MLEPVPVAAFSVIGGQKLLSGSPIGNPAVMADMLEFCTRHEIAPTIETFPMSQVKALSITCAKATPAMGSSSSRTETNAAASRQAGVHGDLRVQ